MKRKHYVFALLLLLVIFLGWRLVRPLNIFVVTDNFARPIETKLLPASIDSLSARDCGVCHMVFLQEWQTSIHSQAWVDPYYQADWRFDGEQQICRNCHTPLDRQQPEKVLGFRDDEKWDPVLVENADFDKELQHEGVTCTACHLRDGMIEGVIGNTSAPHAVKRLDNANQICVRCHVVEGERWDTFFRFPPCGTVAEIQSTSSISNKSEKHSDNKTGELSVQDIAALGCVECHMPAVQRPLVEGGVTRMARRHLWRGGHDPEMVRKAFSAELIENRLADKRKRKFTFEITNSGTRHYLPTGTPDRHLTVTLRLLDRDGKILKEQSHKLIRTVMWRPFIIDLWDTRIPYGEKRRYSLEYSKDQHRHAEAVEVKVRYHLVDESRAKRINYQYREPIDYEVFSKRIDLTNHSY